MSEVGHQHAQQLLDEIIVPFYGIERDMTVPPDFVRDENDAEHSWSLGVMACGMAESIDPTLDVALVGQFCLVHDLTELGAGDTSVWASDSDLATKEEREARSLAEIKEKFAYMPWLTKTLEAYERQDTNEARYVKAMDKYIALLMRLKDGGKFYHDQQITKAIFERNLESHRRKAHLHPGVGELYELARAEYDAHPEYFYPDSPTL